jgi:hypothetical protein
MLMCVCWIVLTVRQPRPIRWESLRDYLAMDLPNPVGAPIGTCVQRRGDISFHVCLSFSHCVDVPPFPVPKRRRAVSERHLPSSTPLPHHVPVWLPSFPETHTYKRTEVDVVPRKRSQRVVKRRQVGGWVGMDRWEVRRKWYIGQERERKTLQR